MEHKDQHFIPQGYLKAWCVPRHRRDRVSQAPAAARRRRRASWRSRSPRR